MSPLGTSVSLDLGVLPFKARKRLDSRVHEANRIRSSYPSKIPVIVEKSHREKVLPHLLKIKFLVPPDVTLGQFTGMIRLLQSSHLFLLFLNEDKKCRETANMKREQILYTRDTLNEVCSEDIISLKDPAFRAPITVAVHINQRKTNDKSGAHNVRIIL